MNVSASPDSPPLPATTPTAAVNTKANWLLRWVPPVATALQVIPCFILLTVSGYRTLIGGLAVFSAAIGGPFELFHQNAVRIPFFVIGGGLSLLNLYLYFYAKRRREAPSAQWRKQPLSIGERRTQKFQIYSSVLTLGMIAGDILSHHLHGLGW